MIDSRGPQPPPVNPSLRVPFQDPIVQRAVTFLMKELAVVIPEAGFERACLGMGPTGICVQIVCVITGRDPGIWTFEVWGRPDGSWKLSYENKQGATVVPGPKF